MQYKDIVAKTAQRAGVTGDQADAITRGTVQALAEQAPGRQFRDLLEQLPKELKQATSAQAAGVTAAQRSLADFSMRVRELSGMDGSGVREGTKAVMATLAETVSHEQLQDVFAQLPPAFLDLLPVDGGRPSAEEFLGQVRQAGGLDSMDEAERAAQATLSVLADRITAGQAQDIALYLPAEVRTHLAGAPERAVSFDREAFVDRIASTEQTDQATAERHARAVLTAVRETVPHKEFADTLTQLPSDIGRLAR
jgi:uncharacterized protein (DUF2267 family)